jgi:Zn-dependent protease with chaperone function
MNANSPAAASQKRSEQLIAALDEPIEPVRVSLFYRLGLLLVALAMVLLPVLYLAVIAGLGWAVYLHAVHDVVIFEGGGGGRVMLAKLALYLAPIVAGVVAVLFMLKPLLARPPKPPETLKLEREGQPLLFDFVEHLTRAVGAPMPREIRVDCEVNASAGFRRGFASFFGSDLALTIGLPLVSGFTLRQLAGVLAHEFGHFAQGGAMRLTYLIRSINAWFARVVYERDQWDERLDQLARESEHWAAMLILALTRGTIWVSRRVLWLLMNLGHVISCFMLRQMEYDADRYEARIAGSDAFETTAERLIELAVGNQSAMQQLQQAWTDGHLGDDLPALVSKRTGSIPPETLQKIRSSSMEEKTSLFATHPADRDRVASARGENAPGIFRFEGPATALFSDFAELSRRATLHYYQRCLGLEVKESQLVSGDDLDAEEVLQEEGARAIAEVFGDGLAAYRPLLLGAEAPESPAEPADTEEAARAVELFETASERLCEAASAEALIGAGYLPDAQGFHLPSADLAGIERSRARAEGQRADSLATMERFELAASLRLSAAFERLQTLPPSSAAGVEAQTREEMKLLLPALRAVAGARERIFDLRREFGQLATLFHAVGEDEVSQAVIETVMEISRSAQANLGSLRRELGDVSHPFSRARDGGTVGEVLITELPDSESPAAVAGMAQHVLEALPFLYYRIVGRLASIALQFEAPKVSEAAERSSSA